MLRTLELRDFAIVDELRLELGAGFTALTGETGAGKSILVDALALLTGGRADAGQIRAGASEALVQVVFDGDGPASAARRIASEGRNHARLDGELVTAAELWSHTAGRLAIFAQHAARDLLSGAAQRDRLDRLLEDDAARALAAHREAFAELREVRSRAERLRDEERERARRLDMLRWQLEEIDAAELRPEEPAELEAEARRLRHAERLRESVAGALARLEDDEGALADLHDAGRQLAAAARVDDQIDALARDLEAAASGASAVSSELQAFLEGFEADPAALERVEARLARLQTLERKYGDGVEAVLAYRDDCAARLEELEGAEEELARLEARADELGERLDALAATVSAGRAAAARALEREVAPLLASLALPEGHFEVELAAEDAGAHGRERVRFLFGANPGEGVGPLATTASGGELARVMLALNLVTGAEQPTLVFDEVDAGVGGRAARSVGRLLASLARTHQVLVVTHLPQVAAFADTHLRVVKEAQGARTVARVERLEGDARERELARMLSGAESDAALRNARELLGTAAGTP